MFFLPSPEIFFALTGDVSVRAEDSEVTTLSSAYLISVLVFHHLFLVCCGINLFMYMCLG